MGCYNSCLVSAPVDDVWRTLRDFHDFSWAPDVMTQVDVSGDKEQPGAKRVLNGVFEETLIELDDEQRTGLLKDELGLGYCNITKCCTEVCPESITITDNAIIPMKERVVDEFYDPVKKVVRKLFGISKPNKK